MSSGAALNKLYESEKDVVLDWFLSHMDTSVRGKLMATYPLHYALLYPGATPSAITDQVKSRIPSVQSHAEHLALYERKPL